MSSQEKPPPAIEMPKNSCDAPTIDMMTADIYSIMDFVTSSSSIASENNDSEMLDILKPKNVSEMILNPKFHLFQKFELAPVEENVNVRDDAPLPDSEVEKLEVGLFF